VGTTVLAVLLAPLWIPLALALIVGAAGWTLLGSLFEYPTWGGVAACGVLVGVTVARAGEEGGGGAGYAHITWDAGVVAVVVTAVAVVARGLEARAARRAATVAVAGVGALTALVYVIVKGAVWGGGDLARGQVAMLVLAAVLPAYYLAVVLRLWRHASPAGCAAAEARILAATCKTPFRQYEVAGMHTVEFGTPGGVAPNPLLAGTSSGDTRPAVVFCHGYMSGTAMYMFNLDAFTADYRVFSVDWLGCGASARPRFTAPTTAATEDFFLEALEAWRAAVGLDTFVLVGHSMGGYLASVYTMRHPARVRHLVLVSPGGVPNYGLNPNAMSGGMVRSNPSSPTPRAIPRWLWGAVSWAWENDMTGGVALRWMGPCGPCAARAGVRGRFSRLVLARPVPPPLLRDMGDYYYHNVAAAGSGEFALRHIFAPGARGRHPIGDRMLDAVREGRLPASLPVTILYGGTHDWMSFAGGKALVDGLTAAGMRATVGTVSPGGHHLYLESPDEFNSRVAAALAITFGKGAGGGVEGGGGAGGVAATAGEPATTVPPPPPVPVAGAARAASIGITTPEADAVGSPAVTTARRGSGGRAGPTGPIDSVVSAMATME